MKKLLIALALAGLAVSHSQVHAGGWHGHYSYGHHHYGHPYYGGGSAFFFGAALGAALTLPFYYGYSNAWAAPGPYYYYNPGPPIYVQTQPVYVRAQPVYVGAESQPAQNPTSSAAKVVEPGSVGAAPPVNSKTAPMRDFSQAPGDKWFVYPSKGQGEQQAANDRQDCGRWATAQSGYDPDVRIHRNPQTGPIDYGRALSACLEGRGYTVR